MSYPNITNDGEVPLSGTKPAGTAIIVNGEVLVPVDGETSWAATVDLSEGTHTLTVQARSEDGNVSHSVTIEIEVDLTAPLAPTVNPVTSPTNLDPLPLSGTKEAGVGIQINESEVVAPDDNVTWGVDFDVAEGLNILLVTAIDPAGNVSTAVAVEVEVDTTGPEAPTVDPYPAATSASSVTFTGTKEPGTSIWFGESEWIAWGSDTTWMVSIPFSEDGTYIYDVTARDELGNASEVVVVTVEVDTQAPEPPSIDALPAVTNQEIFTLSGAKEAGAGIWIDGVEVVPVDGEVRFSAEVSLTEGSNTFQIETRDAAGNASAPVPVMLVLDITPPDPPTIDPYPVATSTTTVTLSGTRPPDTGVWVDDTEVVAPNPGNLFTFELSLAPQEVTQTFYLRTIDPAGNLSSSEEVSIRYDVTPPTVVTHEPQDEAVDVSAGAIITIQVDEPLDLSTLTSSNVLVTQDASPVASTITFDEPSLTISVDAALTMNTVFAVTLTTEVTDVAGNSLPAPLTFSFTTGAGAWSDPVEIVGPDVSAGIAEPQLAVADNGRAMLVWRTTQTPWEVKAMAYTPEGGWGDVHTLTHDEANFNSGRLPKVAMTPDGTAQVAFVQSYNSHQRLYATHHDPVADTWETPVLLNGDSLNPYIYNSMGAIDEVVIDVDSAGRAMVVWSEEFYTGSDQNYRMYSRGTTTGAWSQSTIYIQVAATNNVFDAVALSFGLAEGETSMEGLAFWSYRATSSVSTKFSFNPLVGSFSSSNTSDVYNPGGQLMNPATAMAVAPDNSAIALFRYDAGITMGSSDYMWFGRYHQGSWQLTSQDVANRCDTPAAVLNSSGQGFIGWSSQTSSGDPLQVKVKYVDAGGPSGPTSMGLGTYGPKLAVSESGLGFALYQLAGSPQLGVRIFQFSTFSWDDEYLLYTGGSGNILSYHVAVDGSDRAHVVALQDGRSGGLGTNSVARARCNFGLWCQKRAPWGICSSCPFN